MSDAQLQEQLAALLSKHRPSEVVRALARVCEVFAEKTNTGDEDQDESIGWGETASALDQSLDHIISYGM
jgi:hypothetical protein